MRNRSPALAMVGICCWSLLMSAPALANHGACPDEEIGKARKLMAAGKTQEALAAYHGIEDRCLDVADDLLDLAPAAAKHRQFRKAFHYNQLMAAHSPPAKREKFLAEKEEKLRLEPPCKVEVDSEPRGAAVIVDNKEVGVTTDSKPLAFIVKGGKHAISVRLEGHKILEAEFETEFGEDRVLSYTLEPFAVAKPAPIEPQPAPPAGQVGSEERPEEEQESRAGALDAPDSGPFVGLLGGPVWTDYGDPSLTVGAGMELGLDGGYAFRGLGGMRWLGAQVHGTLLYTPVSDASAGETSHFISVLVGGGARLAFWRLWADIRASVGAAILTGASEKSFFFAGAEDVSGAFAMVAVRAAAGVGWTFYKGLFVAVYPAAIDYMPRYKDFNANIDHVFRYQLAVAAGWEG